MAPDFHEGGKGLIHPISSECFLYFFSQGHYLFSRNIAIPDPQHGQSDIFSILTYEINQSIYLFSQKAKAEIDQLYLVSSTKGDVLELSTILGRDVKELNPLDEGSQVPPRLANTLVLWDFSFQTTCLLQKAF